MLDRRKPSPAVALNMQLHLIHQKRLWAWYRYKDKLYQMEHDDEVREPYDIDQRLRTEYVLRFMDDIEK